jgi:hypoxanthine phosphoribosyltransferase
MGNISPNEISAVAQRADCLYSEEEVELAIDNIATRISAQLASANPILLCVMNGALILTAKLASRLQFPLNIDYVHVTRYRDKTSGSHLQWEKEPSLELIGRVVIVIDDIFDEGATLGSVVEYCKKQGADKVLTVVLVNKLHDHKLVDIKCDFIGLEIEDRYLYGYGMDYKGYLRNATGIYAVADSDK